MTFIARVVRTSAFIIFPGETEDEERNAVNPKEMSSSHRCTGFGDLSELAFIPDHSADGTPVAGSRPLAVLPDGPYAGRLAITFQNFANASLNYVENSAVALRSLKTPTFFYIITFANTEKEVSRYAQGLIGKDPNKDGILVETTDPIEFFPAFEKVRKHVLERARVK